MAKEAKPLTPSLEEFEARLAEAEAAGMPKARLARFRSALRLQRKNPKAIPPIVWSLLFQLLLEALKWWMENRKNKPSF